MVSLINPMVKMCGRLPRLRTFLRTTLTGEVGGVKWFMMYCLSDEGQTMVQDFLFARQHDDGIDDMQVDSRLLYTWTFELASATQPTVGMGATCFC